MTGATIDQPLMLHGRRTEAHVQIDVALLCPLVLGMMGRQRRDDGEGDVALFEDITGLGLRLRVVHRDGEPTVGALVESGLRLEPGPSVTPLA